MVNVSTYMNHTETGIKFKTEIHENRKFLDFFFSLNTIKKALASVKKIGKSQGHCEKNVPDYEKNNKT